MGWAISHLGPLLFENADLTKINFRGARLDHAVLKGATLTQADLSNCRLVNADLRRADLRSAKIASGDTSPRGSEVRRWWNYSKAFKGTSSPNSMGTGQAGLPPKSAICRERPRGDQYRRLPQKGGGDSFWQPPLYLSDYTAMRPPHAQSTDYPQPIHVGVIVCLIAWPRVKHHGTVATA